MTKISIFIIVVIFLLSGCTMSSFKDCNNICLGIVNHIETETKCVTKDFLCLKIDKEVNTILDERYCFERCAQK